MKKLLILTMVAAVAAVAGCKSKTVKKSGGKKDGPAPTTEPTEIGGYTGVASQPTTSTAPDGQATTAPEAPLRPWQRVLTHDPSYKPQSGTYGGQLVMATISAPKSFNPITAGETSTSEYTGLFFLGLTTTDPFTFEVRPELAVSWTVDESGLVWIVKLREDVTWSDGAPFTADDVLFTYDTIYDKRWICSTRDIISGPNGEEWKLRKIDDLTVEFTLFDKNAIFPLLLATEIIPRHKFKPLVDGGKFNEALGVDTPPDILVGTGPFLLDKYELDAKVVLKRNPRYYRRDADDRQLPYLDQLVYLVVPSIDVIILKFQQGEIDMCTLRGIDYPVFQPQQESGNFTIYKLGPSMGNEFLFFNQNTGSNPETGKPFVEPYKLKWFRDVRFRQACSYAIDRKHIVDGIMNGLGYPQYGPINPYLGAYFGNPDTRKYPQDPDKAKSLLADMGLIDRNGDGVLEDADGHEVAFNLTTNVGNDVRGRIAETIRKDLEELGIKINYRPQDFNGLVAKLDSTFDWEACVMGLTGGPEPHRGANVWKSSGRMHMWFPDQTEPATPWEAEIDKLFAEGIRELDPAKRREIYFRWQEIVGQEQPFIYTAASERLYALRNKYANVFPSPFGGLLYNIDEIHAKD